MCATHARSPLYAALASVQHGVVLVRYPCAHPSTRALGSKDQTKVNYLLPRIDPAGFMRVKMSIALRKRTLSPVRLVLEDSSKRRFMPFVVVSLQLESII